MLDQQSKEQFIKDLLEKRTIYLEGNIDSEMARNMGKLIVWLNARGDEEITLYIDSGGGYVSAGLDICDIIRHSVAPVTGIVYRRANSMASVILRVCHLRKAMRHAQLILHDITTPSSLTIADLEDQEGVQKKLRISKFHQASIYRIIHQRSGMPIEEIKKICKEEKMLIPEDAKALGLIDEII